uniref:Metallothionein n=1 Tax=Strongyloides venezuelensis TaxID=75913 RepID=A0A0K0FNL3_STRVS
MSLVSENVLFAQTQVVYENHGFDFVQEPGFAYQPGSVDDLPPSLDESQASFEAPSVLAECPFAATAYGDLSSVRRSTQRVTTATCVWPTTTAPSRGISYCTCCGHGYGSCSNCSITGYNKWSFKHKHHKHSGTKCGFQMPQYFMLQ